MFDTSFSKQGLPYPLGAGSARPGQKKGAPNTENPSSIGFTVLGGGLRPWSQTMASEWARPWGRGRSGFAKSWSKDKQAFGPQRATMDVHTLSLSAWALRRLLRDALSDQEKHRWRGVLTHARPLRDATQFSA